MSEKAGLYARVSTDNQELDNQEEKLKDWAKKNDLNYDLFSEKITGKNDDRDGFQSIMSGVYNGEYDVVVVTKLDRFGRSMTDIVRNIDTITEEDVRFVSIGESIDLKVGQEVDAMTEIQIRMFSLLADVERRLIRQRMEKPYREALKEGRVGRPKKLSDEQLEECVEKRNKNWSYKEIHRYIEGKYDMNIGYDTLRQNLKEKMK